MSTQYDAIGGKYNNMTDLPLVPVEVASTKAFLGTIPNLRVLDLACGTGRYSSYLHSWGASSVLGVDISSEMIKFARESHDSTIVFEFQIANGAHPQIYETSDGRKGEFDLVFAGWFLNYASSEEEMVEMFRNVYINLKPGGRFVAITPNLDIDFKKEELDDRYGIQITMLEEVKDGLKCKLSAYTKPPVEFEVYHLHKEIFERSAITAGFQNLKWGEPIKPDDERAKTGFYDCYLNRPHMSLLEVWKEG